MLCPLRVYLNQRYLIHIIRDLLFLMNYILLYEIYRFTETLTKIYNPYKNISEIYEMEECSLPGYHSHRVIVITLLPSNFDYS